MEAVHQVGNRKRGGESIGLLKYQALSDPILDMHTAIATL